MNRVSLVIGMALLMLLNLACTQAMTQSPVVLPTGEDDCPNPSFNGRSEIVEAGAMDESADACWWLSSGAKLSIDQGYARSLQGELPVDSHWRQRYQKSNPVDTDSGRHPQNLLRLVTRAQWQDVRQEVWFRIQRVNPSASPERGEWSGVLLFQRYRDSANLYYAGLRVDGTAVIKKKLNGRYTTLAQKRIYAPAQGYDRRLNPSLLPQGQWLGLASTIRTEQDGSVHIRLYARPATGAPDWQLAAEASDTGLDGDRILNAGHGGIRADFMDVEFRDYRVSPD